MKIFAPKETDPVETRASLDPAAVKKLVGLGAVVVVESGLGERCDHPDAAYTAAGATVTTDRVGALGSADLVTRVRKPSLDEIGQLKAGRFTSASSIPLMKRILLRSLPDRKSARSASR